MATILAAIGLVVATVVPLALSVGIGYLLVMGVLAGLRRMAEAAVAGRLEEAGNVVPFRHRAANAGEDEKVAKAA